MIFWTKEDSNNLASIARSLEKLAEIGQERGLISGRVISNRAYSFLDRFKGRELKEEKIKVSEVPSSEDEALEEAIKSSQRIQAKVTEAKRNGNVPYIVEDLFDAEELEHLT